MGGWAIPMSPTRPGDRAFDAHEALIAHGRHLERLANRVGALDQLLAQLAGDVMALAERLSPGQGEPPLSWMLAEHVGQSVAVLQEVAAWVYRVYLRFDDAQLPACWLWHADVVEELVWLWQFHREAYGPNSRSVQKAADWHDRYRPGVVKRLRGVARDCDLSYHAESSGQPTGLRAVPLADHVERRATDHVLGQQPEPTEVQLAQAEAYDNDENNRARRT